MHVPRTTLLSRDLDASELSFTVLLRVLIGALVLLVLPDSSLAASLTLPVAIGRHAGSVTGTVHPVCRTQQPVVLKENLTAS